MKVLAGDIGGTHARLGLFEVAADGTGRPTSLREKTYRSADFGGLAEVVRAFLEPESPSPEAASFAVAGPATGDAYRLPNLGWEIRDAELAESLGIPRLRVLNDFDAIGHGLACLEEEEVATLQEGRPRSRAPIAVLGAGTGLGAAYLTWCGSGYRVHSSEGGHAGFAPGDAFECDLLLWLARRYGRASWERVLSGPGLVDLYRFLRERGEAPEREEVGRAMAAGDPAEVISEHALAEEDPLSGLALDRFVAALGRLAGDLSLFFQAEGGLYLAGGIAPKILPRLLDGPFLEAFRGKGRLRDLVERVPVRVILNTDVGLLGAARASTVR